METTVEPRVLRQWREEFEAAAKRPLEQRVRYAFIRTYKPVLDESTARSVYLDTAEASGLPVSRRASTGCGTAPSRRACSLNSASL